jgi:RNA polymerase sigma-70 factor (ECF subfamily)
MRLEPAIERAMLAAVPDMRAFALSLCHKRDRVDDLVQEALLRAIANIQSFQGGTNMTAWLFTILRNNFLNEYRKSRHEVSDANEYFVGTMTSQPDQEAHLQFDELRDALARLPHEQREAVILVGGAGLSYEEAAKICRCAVGTMKSRAFRARARLAELMGIDDPEDFGPDRAIHAALSGGDLRWAS